MWYWVSAATAARRTNASGESAADGFTAVRQLFSGDRNATGELESSSDSFWPKYTSVDSVACSGVPKLASRDRAGLWCGTGCAGAGSISATAATASSAAAGT